MKSFLLWFDDSKNPLEQKVKIAAAYYQKKFSRKPDTCLVTPNMIPTESKGQIEIDGISVRAWRSALPNHLCLGVEDVPEYVGADSSRSAEVQR